MAVLRPMPGVRLLFDRGALLIVGLPRTLDLSDLPEVVWDAGLRLHRAPARIYYALAAALHARGIQVTDTPVPRSLPMSEFRKPAQPASSNRCHDEAPLVASGTSTASGPDRR